MRKLFLAWLILFYSALASAQTVKGNVTLTATATDITAMLGDTECGIAGVQFYISAVPVPLPIGPLLTAPPYTFVWNSLSVPNGTYTLTAKATDKAGNAGACDSTKVNTGTSLPSTMIVLNVIPNDVSPPTITIGAPLSGAIITTAPRPLSARAVDKSRVTRMEVLLNGKSKAVFFDETYFSFVWDPTPYKGTQVLITAEATDAGGLVGRASSTVTVR